MARGWLERAELAAALVCAGLGCAPPLRAQDKWDNFQRERARQMLRDVADAVRKHYYDAKFHGVDIDARFREAQDKIEKADSLGRAFAAIAWAVDGLNDSHTTFLPPSRPLRLDYGYRLTMVADACFVTEVRPQTDAAAKLKPGDQVLRIEGFEPTRESLSKINYFFKRLYPHAVMRLVVRDPLGVERQIEVQTEMRPLKRMVDLTRAVDIWDLIREEEAEVHLLRQRHVEIGDALMVWKMPEFDLDDSGVDRMWDKAREHKATILDLRGNRGGRVTTLERMIGNIFEHDVKIGNRIGPKEEMKPSIAKTRGSSAFPGKLIVLIDSGSASAAEVFARVVQLEHRGTVLGDRSSGKVMESKFYRFHQGTQMVIFYGAAITNADLVMADGKSLEQTGVTPDEIILPSATDIAAGRDPVLARAAQLAGTQLEPAAAGKLFPFEWPPN